jgi:hypothetical protein
LLRNLIGSPDAEVKGALAAGGEIAGATGLSEVSVNNALADTISATGDVPLSIKLVRRSAQFLPDQPGQVGDFAGALGDLTRVTGSTDPNVALGLLAQLGPASRIKSMDMTAKNAAPALIGAQAFGGTAQSSGALFAALTTGTADVTGERSRTATISLAQQLEEASLGKGSFEKSFAPGELKGSNLLERIRTLQGNPALAQKFLDNGSFERTVVGAVTQLLTDPKAKIGEDFNTALSKIGDTESLRKQGEAATGIFKFNRLQGTADRTRALQSGLEQLQVRKQSDRLDTIDLEAIRGQLLETGSTAAGAKIAEIIGRIKGSGTVPVSETENIVSSRIQELRHPLATGGTKAAQANLYGESYERTPTQDENKQAEILERMLELLKKANETNTASASALEKISNKEGGILVGPE